MLEQPDNSVTEDLDPDPYKDGRPAGPIDDEVIADEQERAPLDPSCPEGIDVSAYQKTVDWPKVAASGRRFAYIRVSYSRTRDSRAASHWDGARQAGLVCGGYHFFRFHEKSPVEAQVAAFLGMFDDGRPYGPGTLPPAVDLEWDTYGKPLKTAADRAAYILAARAWLDGVEARLGIRPVIYTGRMFWKEIGNPLDLAEFGLWVASVQRATPRLPSPWSDFLFWQYSHTGQVPGLTGKVDCNVFRGTPEAFVDLVVPKNRVESAS